MLFGHNANGFITTRQDNSRSAVNRFPLLTEFDDFELTFLPFLKLFLSSDELNAQISTGFLSSGNAISWGSNTLRITIYR
jgi:hypothetical protein